MRWFVAPGLALLFALVACGSNDASSTCTGPCAGDGGIGSSSSSGGSSGASGSSSSSSSGGVPGAPRIGWRMEGFDQAHTSRSPNRGPSAKPAVRWQKALENSPSTAPIVDDFGRVYVGSKNAVNQLVVLGFDAAGASTWTYPESGSLSSIAFLPEGMLVGINNSLFGIAVGDGKRSWTAQSTGGATGTLVVDAQGTAYFATNELTAVKKSGQVAWSVGISTLDAACVTCGVSSQAQPAVSPDGALVVFRSEDQKLVAAGTDGTPRWVYAAGGWTILDDVAIYTTTFKQGTELHAVGYDGTGKWVRPGHIAHAVDANHRVYGCNEFKVEVLNPDGGVAWSYDAPCQFIVLDADGTAFVRAEEVLYALRPDGTLSWTLATAPIGSAPRGLALSPEGLLFSADTSSLVAYGAP